MRWTIQYRSSSAAVCDLDMLQPIVDSAVLHEQIGLYLVAAFELLKHTRVSQLVVHGHRGHETWNLSVTDGDFLVPRILAQHESLKVILLRISRFLTPTNQRNARHRHKADRGCQLPLKLRKRNHFS